MVSKPVSKQCRSYPVTAVPNHHFVTWQDHRSSSDTYLLQPALEFDSAGLGWATRRGTHETCLFRSKSNLTCGARSSRRRRRSLLLFTTSSHILLLACSFRNALASPRHGRRRCDDRYYRCRGQRYGALISQLVSAPSARLVNEG